MQIPPSYAEAGLTTSDVSSISQALGTTVAELPALENLTPAQLQAIQSASPEVHSKVSSHLGEVINPTLVAPKQKLDMSSMTILIAQLNKEIGELGVEFGKEGVKITKEAKARKSKERLEKIEESLKKMEDAKKSGLFGKIAAWFGAIAGLIAAIAVTVLTAGAGGATLGLAIVGLVAAIGTVANMALEESGAMDKIMEFFGKQVLGLEGESLEKFKMAMTIIIQATLMIASIASGAGVAKLMKGVEMATKLQKVMQMVSTATEAAGAAVGGVGGGAAGIANSVAQSEVLESQADAKKLQAWIAKLQMQMDQEIEELQKLMEQLSSMAFQTPKKILESLNETYTQLATEQAVPA